MFLDVSGFIPTAEMLLHRVNIVEAEAVNGVLVYF